MCSNSAPGWHNYMEYRTDTQIVARARKIANVSDDDIEKLTGLLAGVRAAADLMESLIQPFGGEVDVFAMSRTVEGLTNPERSEEDNA